MSISLRLTPDVEGYRLFLKAKSLPTRRFVGSTVEIPEEYARLLGVAPREEFAERPYLPIPSVFDYQGGISGIAIRKRKYCVFADCGLGKTLIYLEFARHVMAMAKPGQGGLIVAPLRVIDQVLDDAALFYGGDLPIRRLTAAELPAWLANPSGLAITNYEAIRDGLDGSNLILLILDESSYLKSHYGKWGQTLIGMGRGVPWKMACTGTPAPNDPIEYANHAVFMDQFPNVNAFLARYFVNRGETGERWELKGHAASAFYRSLSHWSIFLSDPAAYGWKDNPQSARPPIHVHIHEVELTEGQKARAQAVTGDLFTADLGGIVSRGKLARIAKSGDSRKPGFIADLVSTWPDESTIVWCWHNDEQDAMERIFPRAASIRGGTKLDVADRLLREFKARERRELISKPKVLGFGLNLQVATRQVFSGITDSYEAYYQAVKRSNRVGSTRPLNVHIPVTELEAPMAENMLRKARRVQADAELQQELFRCNWG